MINFDNVSFSYPDSKVLNDVTLTINDGEYVGILGPNGGGKSTFLKLALGLLKPTSGKITISNKKISYISQTTSISDSSFPATVYEVVSLGLVKNSLFPKKSDKEKINDILKELDIYQFKNRLVNELSGGQLQRVKIAKALIKDTDLIVLDEPDAGMDEQAHNNLISIINKLHSEKKSIIFVSHHPHDLEHADKIYFIEQGQILTYQEELERGHHHVDL